MGKTLIDMGGYSWFISSPGWDWKYTDKLVEDGAVFCVDDNSRSLRKEAYSWYKAARSVQDDRTALMRSMAHDFQNKAYKRYGKHRCFMSSGLEADDIMALLLKEKYTLMTIDKDVLTLKCANKLVDFNGKEWDESRIKTKLPIKRGRSFLAYQLMHGDSTDSIPRRLFRYDRETAKYVMSKEDPLYWAVEMLPVDFVRESLAVLTLPTPLMHKNMCPIEWAMDTH